MSHQFPITAVIPSVKKSLTENNTVILQAPPGAGSTAQISCSCYRLTQPFGNQNGVVWNATLLDLSTSFDFSFSLFPGCVDAGADGLVFTLQPNSPAQMGNGGGGIGYQGINPSLGIELDTYENVWDPVNDHIAVIRNGNVDHTSPDNLAGPVDALPSAANVEDCTYHVLRIVWNATSSTFTIYLDGNLRLTYTGNIVNTIFGGNPLVYWGFVASTGGSVNEHRVCTYSSADFTAPNNFEVCVGDPLSFTDLSQSDLNQINSWLWDFGDNTNSSTQNPIHTFTSAGTYPVQLTITDPAGCPQFIIHNVIVHPLPVLTITPSQPALCIGDQMTLDVSGANQFTWNPSSGLNTSNGSTVIATPSGTTIYTVQGTSSAGCISTETVTVNVDPLPVLSITPAQVICNGDSVALLVNGASSYSWEPDTSLSTTSGSAAIAKPGITTTYTVTGTNTTGCSSSASVTITVNPLPILTVSPSQNICLNESLNLNASGASTYNWSPAAGLSASTGTSVIASPSVTTTYTIVGTTVAGCSGVEQLTLTVDSLPQVTVSQDTSICNGASATLASGGANSYLWSPAASLSSASDSIVSATPITMTVYTVTGTGLNGCTLSTSVQVDVRPLPNMQTTPAPTICDGQSATISVNGATSYSWLPSSGLNMSSGASVIANPDSSTVYTIEGMLNGCSSFVNVLVTVNPLPMLIVSPPMTICLNQSATLQASGASSYNWSPSTALSASSGASVVATPLSSITYTVTGSSLGCTSTETIDVDVAPLLNVTVSPANPVICAGETISLSAQGAGQYQWSPGTGLSSINSSIVDANPTATTSYTVIGTSGSCSDTANFTITVNPLPVVTVNSPPAICSGDTIQLLASGANSFNWSPSIYLNTGTGSQVSAFPVASTLYTVVGSSLACRDTATVMLTVNPLPILYFSGTDTICYGASTTLSVYGANSYQWSPSAGLNVTNLASVVASPLVTTMYTVTGTQLGCSNTNSVTVEVTPLPVLTTSPDITICTGESASLHCSGASTLQWSPSTGLNTSTGNHVQATPVLSQVYTVTGTSNNCQNSAAIEVTVIPVPELVLSPDQLICFGSSVSLSAQGAAGFSWRPVLGLNSDTGSIVLASPSSSTTYTVTGISAGCSDTASVTVGIKPLPQVVVCNDTSICQGQTANLVAGGASSYSWVPIEQLMSSVGERVVAIPDQTTTYIVTGRSNGCDATATVTVQVNPLPEVHFTPGSVSGCMPLTVTFRDSSLTASGSEYAWSMGDTVIENSADATYTFEEPGNYNVVLTVTSPQQCRASLNLPAVSVYSFPEALFALLPEITTILNPVIQLTDLSNDAATWNWSFGDGSIFSNEQNPNHAYSDTGTFLVKLIVKNIHGCADTVTGIVRVNEDYTFYIPNSFSPNADGMNDFFKPLGTGLHDIEMDIYDRWGEIVFSTNSKEGWNGNYNGNSKPCPEGVYVYKLKTLDPKGIFHEYSGHVTLIH